VSSIFLDDWRSVEIDTIVNNKQWIIVIDNIIIDTDSIQVLLKEVLEEQVLFLQSCFLFLDSKLIKMDLVVTFVEVVKHLELIVSIVSKTKNFLNISFWFLK